MSPLERIGRTLFGWKPARWGCECPEPASLPEELRCLECDSIALTEFRAGEEATVTCLREPEGRECAKLMAMGILPGARLTLLQRYPVFLFRLGYSEFAVDDELAARIRVRPTAVPAVA